MKSLDPALLKPPNRLNIALAILIPSVGIGLHALAARYHDSGWALLGIAALFGLAYLPLYTLMHETFHRTFHSDRRVNDAFGVALSALFPGPFTLMRFTHAGHHGRNRTDAEWFDGYYPSEGPWRKRVMFYTLYLGGFWLSLPLVTLICLVWPRLLASRLVQDAPETAAMINGVPKRYMQRIRAECLGIVLLHVALFVALDATFTSYLCLYAAFAFSWSSQNYITHAWTPRDVLNGAHNLKANPLYAALLLHFNWHLAHHQHPSVPWLHLPKLNDPERERPPYLLSWLRFWRGPQESTEPPPREWDRRTREQTIQGGTDGSVS